MSTDMETSTQGAFSFMYKTCERYFKLCNLKSCVCSGVFLGRALPHSTNFICMTVCQNHTLLLSGKKFNTYDI